MNPGCVYDEEDINYDDQDWFGDMMYPYSDCGGGHYGSMDDGFG